MENAVAIDKKTIMKNLAALLTDTMSTMQYGWERWQDESEYEDINDYANLFAKAIEKSGFKFIKMTKRPFGFIVKPEPTITIQYYCNGRNAGFKPVNK